jgi:release factor glutamine methyltransferase
LLRDTAVALAAAGIDNVRFEARLLLAHAAGLSAEQLIARGAEPAPAAVAERLRALAARRVLREPSASSGAFRSRCRPPYWYRGPTVKR